MAIVVSPTVRRPTHHIKLSQGATELGLILSDAKGNANASAIERNPMPSSAIRTASSSPTYSDEELPFMALVQENFSGGRGKLILDDDSTRFYDSMRMDTIRAERVILGPQERFTTLPTTERLSYARTPGAVDAWYTLYGTTRYIATYVTPSVNMSVVRIELLVKKVGTGGGNIVAALYTDAAGTPNALIAGATKTLLAADYDADESHWLAFDIPATALTGATTYDLVVYGGAAASAANHWEVAGISTSGTGRNVSADGAAWTFVALGTFYSRLLELTKAGAGFFFEYKGGWYHCTQPDDGTKSMLYLNGDRGAADDNAANKGRLIDATKAWTQNRYIDCFVLITRGPGSEETQPWRKITANEATYLVVDGDWNVTHTINTEYVILGSNYWEVIEDLAAFVTGYTVAGEFIYFARGDSGTSMVRRYQAYNASGTWTDRAADDVDQAVYLGSVRYPDGTTYVWGSRSRHANYGNAVWRGQVPMFWGDLYYDLGEMAPTDIPWDSTVGGIANVTQLTDDGATKIVVADAFATGIIALYDLPVAVDITQGTKLAVGISSTIDTAAADVDLLYSETALLGDTPIEVSLPALSAGVNTWVVVAHQPLIEGPAAGGNASKILSVGLQLDTNLGAQTIYMSGGIRILSDILKYRPMPSDARINGLGVYAGSADDPRDNVWILTENQIYEIQSQNGDAIVPLPLGELKSVRDSATGLGFTINDVYMYFNLGNKLERYYSRVMEDIGSDLDEGLPENRQGIPRTLLSFPGRVYKCIDGGTDNYSSIMVYKNSGWHEVYRAPRVGVRIRGAGIQSIQGTTIKRLWFRQGWDILWIPISWNPLNDSEYVYTHEGFLETGRIYGGRRDIQKYFHSMKLATERLAAGVTIEVDYKTDTVSTWTEISDVFDTSPYQEISMATANNVSGRWIQFRLRFYTTDNTTTPVLIATILKALSIFEVKYTYTLTFRLADNDINLLGEQESDSAYTKRGVLDTWVASALPITMNSISSFEDSKLVKPSSVPVRRLKILKDKETGKETWICQMTFLEI